MKKLPFWLAWPTWATFVVVFLIFLWVALGGIDPDFGWHLRAGQYFVAHGIPATDVFTFTATDFPWVDHEWLSDILVYLLHNLGGYTLLAVVYAGLWTVVFWLVGRRALGLVVLLAVIATVPYAGVRAITWSILGLALLVKVFAARDKRWWWTLPPLLLLWANLHGSFVIGLFYIVYQIIARRSRRLLLIGVLCLAVTFINPYGIEIYTEVLRTIGDRSLHGSITEWQSLIINWSLAPFLVLYCVGWLYQKARWWRKALRIENIFMLAGLSAQRNWPLFAVVALQSTSDSTMEILRTIPKQLRRGQRNVLIAVGVVFMGMTGYAIYDAGLVPFSDKSGGIEYPAAAVKYLEENPCPGNLFNDYNYGGYLIWRLPTQKVYIDGRMPSWELNGQKYMDDYHRFLDDTAERNRQIDEYNIQCVLVGNSRDLAEALTNSNRWTTVVHRDSYTLLRKNDE
jgi:hypothetical protein